MNVGESRAIAADSRMLDLAPRKKVRTPTCDRHTLTSRTVHIGVGAFHRAHRREFQRSNLRRCIGTKQFGADRMSLGCDNR